MLPTSTLPEHLGNKRTTAARYTTATRYFGEAREKLTWSQILAHPLERRGRKASGLTPPAQEGGHDSGVAGRAGSALRGRSLYRQEMQRYLWRCSSLHLRPCLRRRPASPRPPGSHNPEQRTVQHVFLGNALPEPRECAILPKVAAGKASPVPYIRSASSRASCPASATLPR